MWKPYLIGGAAATILGTVVALTGLGSLPAIATDGRPEATVPAEVSQPRKSAPSGIARAIGWSRPVSEASAGADGVCPMRKVWTDTKDGPRLKWRRICAVD